MVKKLILLIIKETLYNKTIIISFTLQLIDSI